MSAGSGMMALGWGAAVGWGMAMWCSEGGGHGLSEDNILVGGDVPFFCIETDVWTYAWTHVCMYVCENDVYICVRVRVRVRV